MAYDDSMTLRRQKAKGSQSEGLSEGVWCIFCLLGNLVRHAVMLAFSWYGKSLGESLTRDKKKANQADMLAVVDIAYVICIHLITFLLPFLVYKSIAHRAHRDTAASPNSISRLCLPLFFLHLMHKLRYFVYLMGIIALR